MTRSNSRRLLLAGATATALLTLGVFSGSAGAAVAPTAAAASQPCGTSASQHDYALLIDGACVEYIANVADLNLSAKQVTLYRGATRSQAFTDFIFSGGRLRKNITVAVLNWQNQVLKLYNFRNAHVIRYTNNTAATMQFEQLIVE
ncbi:hypothetical protein [Streptomyces griseorubiginosus]|uniref:hypothetical protein n=1 Tax=Streptomyces griseorubiginosus TaxID=67304 RepID=UPI0033C36137